MAPYLHNSLKTKLSPTRITAIYACVGGMWIIVSSLWAATHTAAPEEFLSVEIAKGLCYIAFTATLLWWLCRSWARQIRQAVDERQGAQDKYEAYVKSSPIAIGVIDKNGKILETNAANETLTGYSCEELKTMSIFDLDRTDSPEETAKVFAEIFEKGQAVQTRIIRRKDGSHLNIKVDGVRFESDKAICFSRDISQRIQSERKLLMLNAMLRAIRRVNKAIVEETEIENLIQRICDVFVQDRDFRHAWIALLDQDGKPNHYCDAPQLPDADKLKTFLEQGELDSCLSSTRAEDGLVVAKDPHSQCPDFPIIPELEGCALIGMRFQYDHRVGYIALMANPEIVEDEEEIRLFREVCGDLQYALHTIRVEREKTEALKELIEAKQAAEDANRAKDDFLAVMSHELRTPLNPIIGFSEILLEEVTTEQKKDYVETILNAGNRQLKLIDDILQYMRLSRGKVKLSPMSFRLAEVCEAVIHDASANTPNLDLRMTHGKYGKSVPLDQEVVSDEQMLRGILDNLVSNACKYTNEGHVHLDLSESNERPGEFCFTVEDSGIGIAPEIQPQLFDAFSQADSSYTRRHEGIGLGLAICKKLAELLNGTITVESAPGEGCTFTVRLNIETKDRQKPAGLAAKANRAAPIQFDKPVDILAVDDKADNLLVVEKILTRAGARITHAENGAIAVERSQEHAYDVILMDLAMPVMNGLDASEAIRAKGLNMETPIIAVTADATQEAEARCKEVGMQDLLTKPIQTRELVEAIRKQLK